MLQQRLASSCQQLQQRQVQVVMISLTPHAHVTVMVTYLHYNFPNTVSIALSVFGSGPSASISFEVWFGLEIFLQLVLWGRSKFFVALNFLGSNLSVSFLFEVSFPLKVFLQLVLWGRSLLQLRLAWGNHAAYNIVGHDQRFTWTQLCFPNLSFLNTFQIFTWKMQSISTRFRQLEM